ncbi:MAG: hypothetical protein A2504_15550 [Bdellovibrionales bacterium RIFOXYD12_FULL_39_22]|nr:MAG: hypothetical protein A2385_02980 [Bdellovibrionales bacterium RIFOXYB1_FULL_39_21]OFZ43208.1 MAG: hypothetical protein A2485_12125 [Bdellovibrionales bacterium RIFOXYC12_FULL_39_17]OFZ47946.1 MAG: hypothetical protein A2404_16765 [Bdellovibrionales bacterium RIFOXYC1_FULL_39_130]OFZ75726.1 MAG: hypothetical protein A2560_13265 [Bdellovibrionales bacterium RIFOXYD1_FULL_39_84]OFZ94216.1 MAG: hypothetical protein A2504_15550 [Bdellovibrionales bacterium RIFOXYD12_FULL_39_22]HLE11714.1 in
MSSDKLYGIIVAGVGGQGAITLAQLFLGAAWRSRLHTMQSEVHGMSQRGGSVNAQISISKAEVTAPLLLSGAVDLLISMEPLEALRYVPFLSKNATIITSTEPTINMDNYPDINLILGALREIPGTILVDTAEHAKKLANKNAGNMVLLGVASNYTPIDKTIWHTIIEERFASKGEKVVVKNIEAFDIGKKIIAPSS